MIRTASPRRATHGFTLLEVMVALAVLAIALTAMIKGVGTQVSNQSYLRDRTLAHWVAMNKAAELQIARKWPEAGSETGSAPMGPHEWYWKVTVQNTPDPDVRRMDVAVSATEGGEPVTSLVGYLLKPNELP